LSLSWKSAPERSDVATAPAVSVRASDHNRVSFWKLFDGVAEKRSSIS
jgi:hypothetical protein